MQYTIRNRWTNAVIFDREAADMREAVAKAIATGANLTDADLADAPRRRGQIPCSGQCG